MKFTRPCWCVVLVVVGVVAFASSAIALPTNVPPAAFPPPSSCGCHAALVSEWQQSMHSKALDDKAYQTKLRQAQEATGGKLGAFCNTCHGPIATMTGAMATGQIDESNNGITCMFCHQVTGTTKPIGNVSQTVRPEDVRRAQLRDPAAPHKAAYSQFHETAAICGSCHNVRHPVNGMHLESTYEEWSKGPYAAEGVQCQDCHMTQTVGQLGPYSGSACAGGPSRSNLYAMTFVGANVAQGPPIASRDMLQRAAVLKLEMPEIASGASQPVTVTITNENAGHYLPTGLTEVRQMWLEVTAETDEGKTVVHTRKFGTELADKAGKHPVELWDAVKIYSDDRIPPRESAVSTFTVSLPEGAQSAKITAALYYRSLTEELAKESGVDNPTTTMAAQEAVLYASEEAAGVGAKVEPEKDAGSSGLMWVVGIGIAAILGVALYLVATSRRGRAKS